jgi:acetyl-CoA carboxylase biotin carboxyl carrier protein
MDHDQLQEIRRLLALVDRYGLAELVTEEEGLSVTIRGPSAVVAAAPPVAIESRPVETPLPAAFDGDSPLVEESPADAEGLHPLQSLMTGIFYRSPSPDARAYVEVGDEVSEGQTVGLIEAMKVFSEIPADATGRVVRILAETGKLVTQGDVLMLIRPDGASV